MRPLLKLVPVPFLSLLMPLVVAVGMFVVWFVSVARRECGRVAVVRGRR